MKSINTYINESLKLGKSRYKYHPQTKEELQEIILKRIKEEGNEVDLNDIDVSNITDMSDLFKYFEKFNGDISNWDVSNVRDMSGMFKHCHKFNQDISNWNVSKAKNMKKMMFYACEIEEKYKPKFK